MQTSSVAIPVRSQRQAMDWSLVLVSQGIDTAIEGATPEHGWQLVVSSPDYDRALAALYSYRRENRQRIWHQKLPWTGLLFDWHAVAWFILLIIVFVASDHANSLLREAGIMDATAVRRGEWWRLFTAVMLHQDVQHLIGNVTTGVLLLGLAMGAFGAGHALLASFLAGAGANVIGLLIYTAPHRGLGASGMVMGALGLLAVHSLTLLRSGINARQLILRAFFGAVLLLVLFGFHPETDVIAHVAGFIIGACLGGLLALFPRSATDETSHRISEVLCGLLVALCWWLALR
jgi:membrane associated rhomboid family serine protease